MFDVTDALVDETAAAIHAVACGGESWLDARIADKEQHREEARAALTVAAAHAVAGREVWAETLTNDGTHEFTVTADCDGANVTRLRRTPQRVIDAGRWERMDADDEIAERHAHQRASS